MMDDANDLGFILTDQEWRLLLSAYGPTIAFGSMRQSPSGSSTHGMAASVVQLFGLYWRIRSSQLNDPSYVEDIVSVCHHPQHIVLAQSRTVRGHESRSAVYFREGRIVEQVFLEGSRVWLRPHSHKQALMAVLFDWLPDEEPEPGRTALIHRLSEEIFATARALAREGRMAHAEEALTSGGMDPVAAAQLARALEKPRGEAAFVLVSRISGDAGFAATGLSVILAEEGFWIVKPSSRTRHVEIALADRGGVSSAVGGLIP